MKTLFMIVFLFSLIGCGDDKRYLVTRTETETVIEQQQFEGIYYFDNGGYLELLAADDGEITIVTSGQTIQSVNPQNSTIGTHPVISGQGLEIHGGKIFFFRNFNYTTGNDIEEDVNGSNITGNRRTDVTITKNGDILRLEFKVYDNAVNSNVNSVVAHRVLESI